MKNRYWKNSLFGLVILLLGSCIDPYTPPEISGDNNFLVVDGFLNTGQGNTTITLSRTRKLSDTKPATGELNAQVSVEGELNEVFPLTEQGQGVYSMPAIEANDKKYRLRIRTAAGKEYLSDWVEWKQTPPIDNIAWKVIDDEIQLMVNTHDPANKTHYYQWEFEETWEYTAAFEAYYSNKKGIVTLLDPGIFRCWRTEKSNNLFIGSTTRLNQDIISDFPLTVVPAWSEKLRIKYSMLVKQNALTQEAFEYWQKLKKNTESLGTLFDPQPSQLTGNIHCVNTPDEPVIGYFGAYSVATKRVFISRNELPDWRYPYSYDCELDTVLIPDLAKASDILINELRTPPGFLYGYTFSTISCMDCRIRGTNVKPSFWQ
jgi:hypothetical protein